ncbi:MAG: hypothetical protein WCH43_05865 [Verrucomicrobiota bacterium]
MKGLTASAVEECERQEKIRVLRGNEGAQLLGGHESSMRPAHSGYKLEIDPNA